MTKSYEMSQRILFGNALLVLGGQNDFSLNVYGTKISEFLQLVSLIYYPVMRSFLHIKLKC